MSRRRAAVPWAVLLLLLVGGCEAASPAAFATASDDEIARAFAAASGRDAALAYFLAPAPRVVHDDVRVDTGAEELGFDGVIEADVAAGAFAIDLTVEVDAIAVHAALELWCDGDERCAAAPGSHIDVAGLGGGEVSGRWRSAEPVAGALVIAGADTITFDLDAARDGCVPWRVGARAGEVCE